MDKLRETGDCRVDNFIAQDDREWLIADEMLGAQDGVTQPHGFRLTNVTEVRQIRNVPHLVQDLALAAALEIFFEFQRTIEMIFNRALPAAGDDDNVFDPGRDRFFHDILNQRFVDQRQHLFG